MSYYSDAEDSLKSLPDIPEEGLRKRKLWGSTSESISSEIKDLLEDDGNSLVSMHIENLKWFTLCETSSTSASVLIDI